MVKIVGNVDLKDLKTAGKYADIVKDLLELPAGKALEVELDEEDSFRSMAGSIRYALKKVGRRLQTKKLGDRKYALWIPKIPSHI